MSTPGGGRSCGFEQLESRQLMAADLPLGVALVPDSGASPLIAQPATTGTVQGQVLLITNPDSAASGLPGVAVRLLDEIGQIIETFVTNDDGAFEFSVPTPGTYALQEIQPDGYESLSAELGSGGGIVFEPNLMGEIVVKPDNALVGYNFVEQFGASTSQGGEPQIEHHSMDTASRPQETPRNLFLQLPAAPAVVTQNVTATVDITPFPSHHVNFAVAPLAFPQVSSEAIFGGSSQTTAPAEQASLQLDFSFGRWPIGHVGGFFSLIPAVGRIWKASGEFPLGGAEESILLEGASLFYNNRWLPESDSDRLQQERAVDFALETDVFPLPAQTTENEGPEEAPTAPAETDLPQVARRRAS